MEKDLNGKIAMVTGGASGIGEATALLYAAHGAKVVVSDIHDEAGNKVVSRIREQGGEALFIQADVSQAADCEQLVQRTVAAFGRVDIAFNNAGIGGEANPIGDMSIAGWDKVIAV